MSEILRLMNYVVMACQNILISALIRLLFGAQKKPADYKRVLVFRSGGLGDFLFATPAFNALQSSNSGKYILLTYQSFFYKNAVRNESGAAWLNFVAPYFEDMVELRGLERSEIRRASKALSSYKFDALCFMSHPGEPLRAIVFKIFLFYRLGLRTHYISGYQQKFSLNFFRKYHKGWGFADHKIQGPINAVHELLRDDQIVDFGKLHLPGAILKQDITSNSDAHTAEIFSEPYIVLCPKGSSDWKEWGDERYIELIGLLKKHPLTSEMRVLLFGPPDKYMALEKFNVGTGVFNISKHIAFEKIPSVFNRAAAVVSAEGGLAHLAAFSDAVTIALTLGVERPIVDIVGPKTYPVTNAVVCSPCFSVTHCPEGTSACLRDVSPEKVMKQICMALQTHWVGPRAVRQEIKT